ncbi:MAG: hypothetical protein HDR02_01825 [Lachnospiraceae bacterium]|nr:hypothetical protein [Lachnospiraceae bacterium]
MSRALSDKGRIGETSTFLDYDVLITTGTANDVSGIRALVEKKKVDGIILTRSLDCFSPSVTAVNVSARQVGNMICKQMINFLTGREYQTKTIMDYEILIRKSTGGQQ